MRIAIDYNAGVRQIAGIGRYVRDMVRSFAALDSGDAIILLYAARGLAADSWGLRDLKTLQREFPAIHSVPMPISERLLTIAWQRLRLPLPVERWTGPVDVFHAPDFVLAPVRQARTVVTVHDLTFRIHPETAFPRLRRFLEVAVPRSLRRADRVVAVSHSTARDVEQQLGIAPTKLRVIQHGLNTHFRRVDDAARLEHIRERYGLHAPFLLHVGTIEPRKNLERLMDAFAQLRSPQPLELVLGGRQGWLAAPIVAHAARTPGVRLLGPIDDADLPGVYSLAQGLAYPSLYEGFGFPALEALACGTPVVASRTSSIPEVVGDAALLIAPQDTDALRAALQRLLDEPQLTAAARSAGPIQAASFSWERAARELLAVYREVA